MAEKRLKTPKITLRSLAAELGISPATVMRALNNHPNVTQGIRRKVVTLAMKRNYQLPEHHAKQVAIVCANSSLNGYSALILNALSLELDSRKINFEIITSKNIDMLHEHTCSGVISTVWESGLEKFWPTEHTLPMVILNAAANFSEGIYQVGSDERQGMNLALEYLLAEGKKKIAFISTPLKKNSIANERVAVFHDFCEKHSLTESFHEEHTVNNTLENIADTIDKRRPQAVFVACESYVFHILHALRQKGMNIPEDIAIISLENPPYSEFAYPPLTTVGQDFKMLAFHAVEMLMQRIHKMPCRQKVTVPYTFNERESV